MSEYTELVKNLREEAHLLCDYVSKAKYHKAGKKEWLGLAMREAADAIEALQRACANYAEQACENETRWIPVTERLPEATGHKMYWVIVRSKYPEHKAMFGQVAEYEARFGHPFWDVAQSEYVTHWMPLPEPPEEETEWKRLRK